MAYTADQHSHSIFSFDSSNKVDDMCERAIQVGLSELAVTDHYDINSHELLRGLEVPYDHESAYEALCKARDSYDGKLKLAVGVEIGQIHDCPEAAKKLLSKHLYDQVIGSLHNLRGMPDFYLMAFYKITGRQCSMFYAQYLRELEEIVDIGCFDTLAHITYPLRYFKEGGHTLSLEEHIPAIRRIFEKLIDKGIALEVNASGYRQGLEGPLPGYDILKLYYDMGGRYLTVGSDAHHIEDIGAYVDTVYDNIKKIGFTHICSFTERKMQLKEI